MALKKYIIWDKTSHVYTPSGISFTPEEWIKKYSWINAPGAIPVMSAGIINGAYIGELNQMRSSLENAGIDFSTATTNEEILQIIENFEDQMNQPSTEPTTEERTASALEQIAAGTTSENTEVLNALLGEEEEATV